MLYHRHTRETELFSDKPEINLASGLTSGPTLRTMITSIQETEEIPCEETPTERIKTSAGWVRVTHEELARQKRNYEEQLFKEEPNHE